MASGALPRCPYRSRATACRHGQSPSESGYVTGTGAFKQGQKTTLTAVPERGYVFVEWREIEGEARYGSSSSGYPTDLPRSFTTQPITQNITYIARFERDKYEIKIKNGNKSGGSIKGDAWVERGDSATIEAEPNDGYEFKGWYEDGRFVSSDRKYKVTNVKRDHTYEAQFRKHDYLLNIVASPSEGGTVMGGGRYEHGQSATVKAAPANGYELQGLMLNGQTLTTGNEFTIGNVDRDLSITAYFVKKEAKKFLMESGVANKGGPCSRQGPLRSRTAAA